MSTAALSSSSPLFSREMQSPVGTIRCVATSSALVGLYLDAQSAPPLDRAEPVGGHAILELAIAELSDYFAGRRQVFSIPLEMIGTAFQRRVWQALMEIPFGETWSYSQLARRIGNPRAVRAVGAANGRNPVSIVVPCHRVIGASGQLVGYGGGLPRKRWLLEHERAAQAATAAPGLC